MEFWPHAWVLLSKGVHGIGEGLLTPACEVSKATDLTAEQWRIDSPQPREATLKSKHLTCQVLPWPSRKTCGFWRSSTVRVSSERGLVGSLACCTGVGSRSACGKYVTRKPSSTAPKAKSPPNEHLDLDRGINML